MQMLQNEADYRRWIMAELFMVRELRESTLFVEQEIEDFIFDARPTAYPCIAVMVQTKGGTGGVRAGIYLQRADL
ncbi:hypothetical protein [Chimaeribacter arupi]|uniref:hypothetical protein n=1 Tax=Chimaeribacter arupi TaxID=2060066 RepID=UPI002946F562|nr:hypothetical protein [Chimaeribacter arupi]MDV5139899.1 hypothetical protein [Chimaeribacter arupi]